MILEPGQGQHPSILSPTKKNCTKTIPYPRKIYKLG